MARSRFNERRPKRPINAACFDHLKREGYTLSSRGWPDYLAVRDGGKETAAVWVSARRNLRAEQLEVALLLKERGWDCLHYTLDGTTIPITGIRNSK